MPPDPSTIDLNEARRVAAERSDKQLMYAQVAGIMALDNEVLEEVSKRQSLTKEQLVKQIAHHNKKSKEVQQNAEVRRSRGGGMAAIAAIDGCEFDTGEPCPVPALCDHIEALRGLLLRYGKHEHGCKATIPKLRKVSEHSWTETTDDRKCSCGFRDIKASIEAAVKGDTKGKPE